MLVLPERVQQRRANHRFYERALGNLPGVSFLPEPDGSFSNRWLTCIQVNPELSGGVDRERIRLRLEQDNIESRPLWKPMHCQPVFEGAPYYGEKVAETLFQQGLCLPSGSNLSQADLNRISEIIRQTVNN
jgi:dTDP-4-amino-4,6-dideoxygalactose transaminase